MGNPFKRPKAPDTSRQEALAAQREKAAQEEALQLRKKEQATQRARRGGGMRSLLSGLETGTDRKTTLG